MRLAGKAAVVTGAASGIGAAVAQALLEEGATVRLVDRQRAALCCGRAVSLVAGDTPLGRLGAPSELTGAFVFIASDESAFATGAVFTIDGG